MAFLNLMKKREELPADIDLDVSPEPPEMTEKEISIEEPIDEGWMPLKKSKPKKEGIGVEEKLPELPPLPDLEEELPPLYGEKDEELGDLDLPAPPEIKLPSGVKPKKGLFSFLKWKKVAKKLPELKEEIPELPPLPEVEEREFPEIPPMPKRGEEERYAPPELEEVAAPIPKYPELEKVAAPAPIEPIKRDVEESMPKIEKKPTIKEVVRRKRFITINDFRSVQNDISDVKDALKGIDGFFHKLDEVSGIGDKKYSELHTNLKDIQRKIMFVDKTLFKEQNI